ncbi:transposase, partial [Alkalibacterium sp. m-11]
RAKKQVQPLLQAAYKNNPDGFYIHAPKRSKTHVKGLLGYIGRLVRHIPDEQFKMVRHYGLYSRRIKTLMKIVVKQFQLDTQ